jgi:hypothetical protein
MEIPKYNLKEALLKDHELGEAAWNDLMGRAQNAPVYRKLLKEGLYSDVAGALGAVQDAVWAAAWPNMISRDIITVIPTKNALERFPKELAAEAYEGEGPAFDTGQRAEMTDIKANREPKSKKEWTESYVEDASWDVLRNQITSIGKALAKFETKVVIAAYKANESGDAGTVDIAAAAVTWANICDVIGLVESQDFHPNVFALHPKLFQDLMKLDQFTSSLYKDRESMRKGVVYHTTLDISFVNSSLVTFTSAGVNATYGYCIDTEAVGAMILRRDVNTKPYEDPARQMYGVSGNSRFGLGVLRAKAIARLRGTRS